MLGGVGACLTITGAISSVVSLVRFAYPSSTAANLAFSLVSGIVGSLTLVGFILFFVAMYGLSKDYSERKIFNYVLFGLIITIVAAIIAAIIMFAFFLANFSSIFPNLGSQAPSPQLSTSILSFMAPFLAIFGFVFLINVVFTVLALNLLAVKSQVPLFRTSAKVFLAGAVVQIVAGIVFAVLAVSGQVSIETFALVMVPGGLVQYAAWALLAVSFFRITALPTQTGAPPNEYHAVSGQVKYCPYCGAQNSIDTVYCKQCGKKQ